MHKFYDRVFVVTFDLGVGESYEVLVVENSVVIKPEEPKKAGYKFVGWYHQDHEYDFTTYVTKNMRIDAIWEKELDSEIIEEEGKIRVVFDVNGGTFIVDQVIVKGGTASKPLNPTIEGYTFLGWELDGKSFDFATLLYENTTIVATWKENR